MASPKNTHRDRGAAATTTKQQQSRTSKPRPLLLRRAMLHSCLCFLLGLFTGLAPSDWTDAASRAASNANAAATAHVFRALHAVRAIHYHNTTASSSLLLLRHHHHDQAPQQPQLLVVVTTTEQSERERRAAGLTRTAHALRLVSPPLVWLVVEAAREAPPTAQLLRRTGVVYRHVTYKENLSSDASGEERHHQRNVALGHIEQHRLDGIVFFAGLGDVYDLRLLEQLRQIRTFGAWAVATVWEQEKRVALEGPLCTGRGWFSTPTADDDGLLLLHAATQQQQEDEEVATRRRRILIRPRPSLADVGVHGFAFSSHLLWDPARWDRFPTSEPDQSQVISINR
uniref:Glycosyltransferases n=1 Tax=Arundo donax TaxID=35708 RepID=A0A0A9D0R5_ARUDO